MADEERFDRLESQMSEMLGLMGRLVNDFNQHRKELTDLTSDFNQHRKEFADLTNNFNQHRKEFADVVSVVIVTEKKVENLDQKVESIDQKLTDFQAETRTNFERVFRENIITNRRVDILTPTVSEVQARVQELENRMEKVEHRIAA